jgi:DNA mismatch repair ATPase MutS
VLWLLERWQRRNSAAVRPWLEVLGEFEALAGLATLAHDHPDWQFPMLTPEEPAQLVARKLAHPLLRPAIAVANDVQIGPAGSFLLVTGSNMSGKSTLLRSIGLNVALAQAGGPVCAAELRLPPLQLATSMRVSDSLELGVSYFMAELQRLKDIVDAAEQVRGGPRTLLFLLDEILHGTNTAERQIAARRIIRHLLAQGAIGAVSTHDLGLAEADDLAAAGQTVHFGERLDGNGGGPLLRFDYTLRPGLAGSTNALKLMALIGLPQADE